MKVIHSGEEVFDKTNVQAKNYGCIHGGSSVVPLFKGIGKEMYNRDGKSKNRYLKPGALAHMRDTRAFCKAIGRKRVLLLHSPPHGFGEKCKDDKKKLHVSNVGVGDSDPATPKTPQFEYDMRSFSDDNDSRLESLPMDLQVRILCHLQHNQLKPLSYVSRRIRRAVFAAKRLHFNYTTPERSSDELVNREGIVGVKTPRAPRHGPRAPSRFAMVDMRGIAASLFQGTSTPSAAINRASKKKKSKKKMPISHRVLHYEEEELCRAVAHNTI